MNGATRKYGTTLFEFKNFNILLGLLAGAFSLVVLPGIGNIKSPSGIYFHNRHALSHNIRTHIIYFNFTR